MPVTTRRRGRASGAALGESDATAAGAATAPSPGPDRTTSGLAEVLSLALPEVGGGAAAAATATDGGAGGGWWGDVGGDVVDDDDDDDDDDSGDNDAVGGVPRRAVSGASAADDVAPPLETFGMEPPVLRHRGEAGRRQRAFETVLTAGFISVLCSTVMLGLSEAITIAELKGFVVAISTCVTIVSFVATYLIAGKIKHRSKFQWWQPFQGGIRFVLLQAAAWMFFAVSLLLPLAPLAAAVLAPTSAVVGLSLCGGVSALLGQIAMVCSLPLFQHGAAVGEDEAPPVSPARPTSPHSEWFADEQWWGPFIAVQVLVALGGGILSVTSDAVGGYGAGGGGEGAGAGVGDGGGAPGGLLGDEPSWVLGLFALFCVILSTTLTHGIGGRWMHRRSGRWCFFQPGEGGARFVALQALSWTCFALSVWAFGWRLRLLPPVDVVRAVAAVGPRGPTHTSAALLGVAAQLLNAASLSHFRAPPPLPRTEIDPNPLGTQPLARMCWVWLIFNVDKMLVWVLVASWGAAQALPATTVAVWTVAGAAYIPTYFDSPSRNGRRRTSAAAMRWLIDHMAAYFRFRLVRVPRAAPLDAATGEFIFGFHPHGIVPVTCTWATLTREWASAFPGVQPSLLVSSVIHFVPILRDLAQLMGSFEVSRDGFVAALDKVGAVMLVPGGQAEMLSARSGEPVTTINTRHKGFVRLAMQRAAELASQDDDGNGKGGIGKDASGSGGVGPTSGGSANGLRKRGGVRSGSGPGGGRRRMHLVPVYSFSENELLDNVQVPRALQEWSIRTLRANVLFLPYGTYGAPGFPRRVPATVVVGRAIKVPPVAHPTRDQVEALHRLYMHELREAFEHFKGEAGCGEQEMVFDPPLEPLGREAFDARWRTLRDRGGSVHRADRKPAHNVVEIGVVSVFFLVNYLGLVLLAVSEHTPCAAEGGWGLVCH